MKIQSLTVENYGVFTGKQSFEFKPGVSIIYGLNQSTSKFSKNSNWVGKSLFFNSLSEVLYDEPIVGQKADKMKSGTRSVVLVDDDGRKIEAVRRSGKRESLEIFENGKPLEHLTKTKAQEFLDQAWGVSLSEFETFIHLDSRIPHPLVMGSSTDRKHFFDDFFRLDRVDEERKIYLRELRSLGEAKSAYLELKASYNTQKTLMLSDEKRSQMEAEATELRHKRELLHEALQRVETYRKLKITHDSLSHHLTRLPDVHDAAAFSTLGRELRDKIASCEDALDRLAAYAAYRKAKKQYDDELEKLPELARSCSRDKLRRGHELFASTVHDLRMWQRRELELPEKPEVVAKPALPPESESIPVLKSKRSEYRKILEVFETSNTGVCPTCGQPLDASKKIELEKSVAELTQKIKNAEEHEAYSEYLKDAESYAKQCQEVKENIDLLKKNQQKYKKYSDAFDLVSNLPRAPETPDVKCPKESKEELNQTLAEAREVFSAWKSVNPYREDLCAFLDWDKETSVDFDEQTEVTEKIAKIEAKLTMDAEAREALKTVVRRLKDLKTQIQDEDCLKELVEIFSDKQLKRDMVAQISDALCRLLNKYSRIVFDSDYTFTLEWGTQLQLLCTRKVGAQELTSDVRKLSGAESKLFTLILILSLLSFVPPSRRPQLMILDEPTANFSSETTQAFIRLLNVLKTVVPSIVIITPRDDIYPESYPYTVVRTKSGSSIVPGLPVDILSKDN